MLDAAIKHLHSRRGEISKQMKALEAEGKKLGQALKVLAKLSGKTAVEMVQIERKKISAAGRKKKRTISAAGRKAIAAAKKAWWAEKKKAEKKK